MKARRATMVALVMILGLAFQAHAEEHAREKRPDQYLPLVPSNVKILQAQLDRLQKGHVTQKDFTALSQQVHDVAPAADRPKGILHLDKKFDIVDPASN